MTLLVGRPCKRNDLTNGMMHGTSAFIMPVLLAEARVHQNHDRVRARDAVAAAAAARRILPDPRGPP